jgi:hypothetical protein
MENKTITLEEMSVVELKAHLFDLQDYVQKVHDVLLQKIKAEKLPPVEAKKE